MTKILFAAATTLALASSVAFAQDPAGDPPPATDPAVDPAATDPAADPATDPAATDPAATDPATTDMGGEMAPMKKMSLGADVGAIIPLGGGYGDSANAGLGGFLRFEYNINAMMAATLRVGGFYHLTKIDDTSLLIIPIMAGIRYNIGTSGLFGAAELGMNYIRAGIDVAGVSATASETKFGFAAGVGYKMNKLSFRGQFYVSDVGEIADAMGALLTVGFDFAQF